MKELKQESGLAVKRFGENNMIVNPEILYALQISNGNNEPKLFYIDSNIPASIYYFKVNNVDIWNNM